MPFEEMRNLGNDFLQKAFSTLLLLVMRQLRKGKSLDMQIQFYFTAF